ncbi:MAG: UDP-N-acetylmuramoyl-tripeptide--D-alanyl-D-alanine ligase [bacterium]|nr:UDP-N-acetylmuramoyl-tripeptide--D-alanyl-D-alanine ligase [bacterium]
MKRLLQSILASLARGILRRYQPKVVAVTGSVGKTSAKEAIALVLGKKFLVRKSGKNYNNEIGVPLTVIGIDSGNRNPFAWFSIIAKAWALTHGPKKEYPEVLVMELGADHPGDIRFLTNLVSPEIGVVTAVGPVHLEFFSTIEKVANEKGELIKGLPQKGWAILNADDDLVVPMKEASNAQKLTYGFGEKADVRLTDITVVYDTLPPHWPKGMRGKIIHAGNVVPVAFPGIIGRHQLYSPMAAVAVGLSMGMHLIEITKSLSEYRSPAGRMNLIPGIKKTMLIDDSYNSSPVAAEEALETIQHIQSKGSKYAALGDMAELGQYTETGHEEVGVVASHSVDFIITVGEKSRTIAQAALSQGFPKDRVFRFDYAQEAGKFLQHRIKPGDILLIKGSQVARMEKVTKELMAEPLRATQLLVRQSPKWLKK